MRQGAEKISRANGIYCYLRFDSDGELYFTTFSNIAKLGYRFPKYGGADT